MMYYFLFLSWAELLNRPSERPIVFSLFLLFRLIDREIFHLAVRQKVPFEQLIKTKQKKYIYIYI